LARIPGWALAAALLTTVPAVAWAQQPSTDGRHERPAAKPPAAAPAEQPRPKAEPRHETPAEASGTDQRKASPAPRQEPKSTGEPELKRRKPGE
jgi:hypothetical protein